MYGHQKRELTDQNCVTCEEKRKKLALFIDIRDYTFVQESFDQKDTIKNCFT